VTRQVTAAAEVVPVRVSRRRAALLAIVAVLVLGGAALALGLLGGGGDRDDAEPGSTRTADAEPGATQVPAVPPESTTPGPGVDAGPVEPVRDAAPAETPDAALVETKAPARTRPVTPVRKATLSVNTQPWSTVTLDGKRIGDTPIRDLPVAPGRHRLVLNNPIKNLSREVVVNLKPGEARLVSERLE